MSGGLRMRVVGAEQLAAKLRRAGELAQKAAAAGAYNVGLSVLRKAVRNAPKKYGVLRGSGYVTRPDGRGQVTVGFGGPAKAYAWVQHENLSFKHTEGGPKYLSRAIEETRSQAADLFLYVMKIALQGGGVPPTGGGAPDNPNTGPTHSEVRGKLRAKKAQARAKERIKAARARGKAAGAKKVKAAKAARKKAAGASKPRKKK